MTVRNRKTRAMARVRIEGFSLPVPGLGTGALGVGLARGPGLPFRIAGAPVVNRCVRP